MTSGEIEDVLSSIRRLVTDDLKPRPQATLPSAEPDKLLLTPALRVEPDGSDASSPLVLGQEHDGAPRAVAEDKGKVGGAREKAETVARLNDVVATIGAAVAGMRVAWESETGDAAVTRLAFTSTRSRGAEPPPPPDPWAEPVAAEAAPTVAQPEQPEPEGPSPSETVAAFVHRRAMEQAEADALAEIEAAREDAQEPATGWSDAADDAGQGADMKVPPAEPVIDEATLREIVREVLREELQGPLGERMTSSIRKLVRAEVHRAIATRDID